MENYLTPSERMQLAERLRAQRAARLGYSPTDTSALSYYLPKTAAQPLSRQVRGATVPEGRSTETREAKDDAEWYERAGATLLDLGANVGLGAFDALEGIYDIGAGLVGEIGGWFSEDFKKAVVEHVEYDAIGSIEKTLDDLGLEHSYLNEEGPGSFVGDVARGVGGMLPAIATSIAITAASMGTAAPVAFGLTAAQLASLGVMAGGAAGQSTEEALNDGANLEEALLYGAASGAVEAGTEMLLPGLTGELTGKGLPFLKSLAKSEVADTGAKRIFKGMAEEAFEEGLATAVNPLTKTTYKGAEALKEYTEPEFLGDVLRDAVSGAAVAGAFGGTVGRIMHTSGKDADIQDSIEAIKDNDKELGKIWAKNGTVTDEQLQKVRENKAANLANIERTLQNANAEQRQKLIERHKLSGLFDESGKIKPDARAKILGGSVAAPTAQTSATQSGQGAPVASRVSADRRYVSPTLYSDQARLSSDMDEINKAFRKRTGNDRAEIHLYSGELTAAEAEAFSTVRQAVGVLSNKTNVGINLALVEGRSDHTVAKGVMRGNTLYISKEALTDGDWAGKLVHELTHYTEGTKGHTKLVDFLSEDSALTNDVFMRLALDENAYNFSPEAVDTFLRVANGENVLDTEGQTEYNGEKAKFSLDEMEDVRYDREGTQNKGRAHSRGEGDASRIERKREGGSGVSEENGGDGKQVRSQKAIKRYLEEKRVTPKRYPDSALVEPKQGSTEEYIQNTLRDFGIECYVVKESAWDKKTPAFSVNGRVYLQENISADVRNSVVPHEVTHIMYRMQYPQYLDFLENTPIMMNQGVEAMNIIARSFKHIKAEPFDKEIEKTESKKRDTTIEEMYTEVNATVFGHYVAGDWADPSNADSFEVWAPDAFYDFDAYISELASIHEQFKADMQEVARLEKTDAHSSLESTDTAQEATESNRTDAISEARVLSEELGSHLSEEVLGSEAFMRRIIESDKPLAARLISRIQSLARSLTAKTDATSRAEAKRIAKAEKLWLKAVKEAGYKYADGKLVASLKEDEEEDVTRMNAEKMQDGEKAQFSLDKSFSQQVDDVLSGADTTNTHLKIMDTPSLLKEAGLPDLPMLMTAKHLKTITGTYEGKKGNIHSLDVSLVKNLPQYLSDPVMIMDSLTRDDSVVLLVEEKDQNGLPVICAVKLDGKGRLENIDVSANVLTSAYGKDNFQSFIDRNAESGTVFYWNEKKTRALFDSPELQLPDEIKRLASNTIIRKAKAFVKISSKKTSEKDSQPSQFSLSTKQESESGKERAWDEKAAAQDLLRTVGDKPSSTNATQKFYTREEVSKLVDAIVSEQLQFGERYGAIEFRDKRAIIRRAWEKLNAAVSEEERQKIASDIADYIIESTVAQRVLSKEDAAILASARQIMHSLDLDGIKAEIRERLGAKTSAYMVWGKRSGGKSISIAEAKKIFKASGIEIKATSDADVFFEIRDRYEEIKQRTHDESEILTAAMPAEELKQVKKSIESEILSFAKNGGSPVNFSRIVESYERRVDKLKKSLDDSQKSAKLIREIVFRAGRLKDIKLGKTHYVSEFNDPTFRDSIGKLSTVARGGHLSATKAREVSAYLYDWMGWADRLLEDASPDVLARYDLPGVRKMLKELADGKGALTVEDLQKLSHVIGTLLDFVETYNKIYRNGRYIDATDVAKAYIKNIERSNGIRIGFMRKLFESGYMGSYADPATLMRYADKYAKGFFTETFNEFRDGAINVELTRMQLSEKHREFMDSHKDYMNHLEDTIDFRGQQIPVGVAISLWMTSKREQAWLGLAKSGAQYRIDPKDKKAKKAANGIKIVDIAPVAENPETYTKDNIKDLASVMKQLRADIEAKLSESDMQFIKMAEQTFNACGDIKIAVDTKRMGRTNVDKEQYYYPIARANKATTIDTESWMEGLDRVSHLSMNKDTVEGASGRLYIGNVNDILTKHINQVSLYNGIAIAVDNFNVLVNLNTSLNPGAPISVNSEASRTDFGKKAIDYLREMKKDIEKVKDTDLSEQWMNKTISFLRGSFASYQLGANLKVLVTQTSSFIAAADILDTDCIARGFAVREEKKKKPARAGDAERVAALRKQSIAPVEIKIADGFDVDFEALEKNQWNAVRKPLIQKLRDLGFLKSYQTDSIDVTFEFTGEGLRKSMNSQVSDYGGNLADLAKVAMNLQPLLDNAVLIENHPDKAKGTPKENSRLIQTYVLLSAYTEGNTLTPVQFEVKQYVDDQNRLYLAVALTKIKKTGVIDDTALTKGERTRLLPVSDISIPRLIENINPADENFFKYIPDELLNNAQLEAKKRALEKEARKYGKAPLEYLQSDSSEDGVIELDVDKYCPLAKLRNLDNTAYKAQSVSAQVRGKVSEALMKPIGKMDRLVIRGLWGACQVQVEKNHKGDASMKVGTEENKIEAGKLLEQVILETQQNSMSTERSSAMRSDNEIQKTVTMFSADAMKIIGRVIDARGEVSVINYELKKQNLSEAERKALEARKKKSHGNLARSIAVLLTQAAFMAVVALAFKDLLARLTDKEPEEIAEEVVIDGIGNLLGGLPWIRDVFGFAMQGYELDSYLFQSLNDLLSASFEITTLVPDLMSGKKDGKDAAKTVRSAFYAGGQVLGIPTRNVYNYVTGLTKRLFPDAGYAIDSAFTHKQYSADLKRAIEKGDDRMISMISGLITDEGYPNQSKETKETLRDLASKGYVVLPRSVGDMVTVDGSTVELTDAQKKIFQKIYAISDKSVDELVSMQMFKESTSEEKAKALKKIYDLYYNLAVDHALGLDTEERSVLFAEALDVELLAMIAARANELKADVDKNGKTISGSRKAKVTKLVASLKLTAAEKYMVMGYLGYKNVHGANQVKAHINRLDLSKKEKERLFAYCGYGAAS